MFNEGDNVIYKEYSVPRKVSSVRSSVLKELCKQKYLIKTENGKTR